MARLVPTSLVYSALLAAGLLVAGAASCSDAAPADAISPEELAARIASGDAPRILDVRTPAEFAAGHLPGARNIPHDELASRLGELDAAQDEEIVVHCHSGRRAAVAEEVLGAAGYRRVRDLSGHWQEWERAGLPTE